MRFAGYSVILSAVLRFAHALVNSRLYGVDVVGEYALVCTPWFILQTISTINERTALTRELATLPRRSREATGVFGAVLAFSFALTLFMAVGVAIFTGLLFHGPVDAPQLVLPGGPLPAWVLLLPPTARGY